MIPIAIGAPRKDRWRGRRKSFPNRHIINVKNVLICSHRLVEPCTFRPPMKPHRRSLPFWTVLLSLLVSAPAVAQSFNFTFTDSADQVSAFGSISVTNGVATVGSITVSGPSTYFNETLSLATLVSPVTTVTDAIGGDNESFDNLVYPTTNPVFNGNGLGFVSSTTGNNSNPNYWVNLWGNSPDSYTLFEAGNDPSVANGQNHVYAGLNGTLTLTEIPEPSSLAALMGLTTLGFAGFRRFRRRLC